VCWKPCSSCRIFHLLREESLSAPIHSPLSGSPYRSFSITRRSANYIVIGTDLYRKAASTGVLMKCILRSEGLQLLAEIHSGECGCHVASTNLVSMAYRSGFYCPTAMTDAKDLIKRCKGCQFFAKQQHLPARALRTIPLSWPFAMWGLDAVGQFRTAPGGYKHILVAVEKFTKWIEVWPVA
jgi:hypothetical protein